MGSLLKIIKLGTAIFFLFFAFVFLSLIIPQACLPIGQCIGPADTCCNGDYTFDVACPVTETRCGPGCLGTFRCCTLRDVHGTCIATSVARNCEGGNQSQCEINYPNSYCAAFLGVAEDNCSWSSPPPPPPPTGTPPPPPPPGVTPTETPPPPPVIGNPRPTPYVPCDEVRSPEFHSLRPYQASPCNLGYEDLALFCGNDLIISDPRTVTKTFSLLVVPIPRWNGSYSYEGNPIGPACFTDDDCDIGSSCVSGRCSPGNCKDNGDGTETCWFNIERIRNIAIDLKGAFLPIMGFTEPSIGSTSRPDRVINSVFQSETMDDAEKVNEYVSWYLHSIIGRAEYDPPDPDTIEGRSRIIDFSGPLKRLLSAFNQEDIRQDEIDDAQASVNCDPNADPRDPDCIRHNQVVVCTNSLGLPTHCYPPRPGVTQRRLTSVPSSHREYIPFSSTEDRLGKSQIATYSIQPALSSTFIILSSAILSQTPATLYFAHMQEGSELAQILQGLFAYEGANLEADPEPAIVSTSDFCDLRGIRSNPGDNLFAGEITATVSYNAMLSCTYVEEGSGLSGDPNNGNLCRFFTGADCIPDVPDNYECSEYYGRFDCESGFDCARDCNPVPTGYACDIAFANALCAPNDWTCDTVIPIAPPNNCPAGRRCCQGYSRPLDPLPFPLQQECTIPVQIAFRTTTETPLAEDVWKRLVANPVSVFRRIFPQIEDEEGRPITRLFDMPAATSVIYSGEGVIVAGNPGSGRPANQAELYFPHIGGVHEYFLKCIQKTLRPEGFGEGCISGPEPLVGLASGDCATPPPSGAIGPGAGRCQPGTGFCSPGNLGAFGSLATEASIICNMESGGNPNALNCGCFLGRSVDYSVGLFQINLLAHCSGAMSYTWSPPSCTVLDQSKVDACLERFFDPDENIQYAAGLRRRRGDWGDWAGTARPCGLY